MRACFRFTALFLAFASSGASLAVGASAIQPPPELAASKRLFDSWKTPVPPRQLVANIYYVGASGVSSFLITTPQGHFLLDTGFEETVPLIARGVEQLGFKVSDIKFILSSHTHIDHTGGHAAMQKLTGATIVASAGDARILETGGADDYSPFPKELMKYPPAKAGRIIRDGESLTLGGITLTAHLTPGHTRGSTTWTTRVESDGAPRDVVFFSSVSIVAGTSLVLRPPYPEIVDDYRSTFAKLKALPCDIWFSPHGGQFAMGQKLEQLDRGVKPNPFIDPNGWRRVVTSAENGFNRQLEAEKAERK